ncbi:metal-dependent transcriptional regulator [Ornithinicoccus hortensis]|uniref:DtxR family iron (Metal) dependent repressor n=1 Tax=Ornithinicoccus hortensis TaxID=82346 RepID=A0A542YVR4_9MICO|nr:metal-dependent transcriptional regulator [Ornithinicoccus hortensis]TQL52162.1 DtxR family iron (metal) dependent repressor [Ornithinicoccus hortensis]
MTDLIDTTEMYLKAVFELEEDGVVPMRARIAERLGHSGPTVSQTVARMERDGLLTLDDDRHLKFTEEGRLTATRVMRKHRLAERLLVDVIGLDFSYVHDEACRWEHVMSERVERRILGLIATPDESPYGNPIPGLEELGGVSAPPRSASGGEPDTHLEGLATEESQRFVVTRIGEPAQVEPEVLDLLTDAGVLPGKTVEVRREGDRVIAGGTELDEGSAVSLPGDIAAHIFGTPA